MSTQKTTTPPAGSTGKSVSTALSEAQTIISAAEQRAAELKSSAEQAYEEARQAGFAAGFEEGVIEATKKSVRLIEEGSLIGRRLSEEAARLAIAICGTIIGEHVRVDPELVRKIAERALQQSVVGDVITLIVHPDDKPKLLESMDSFRRLANGASVSLDEDPAVSRGGCIVRTEFGEVDASLPVLIDSMANQLGIKMK